MVASIRTRVERLEQAQGSIMAPGQLPEKQFIACFDPETDRQGNHLPVIEMGGIFRLHDETEDDFFDRVLKTVCAGKPVGYKPVLIARRMAPMEVEHVNA